jgi:hypothetical protein
MKKDDIIKHIKGLKPNQAIVSRGRTPGKLGTSCFNEDGIRITGRPEFIDAVLGRIKDTIFAMDNETTSVKFTYQKNPKDPSRYAFYAIPEAKAYNYDYEMVQLMRQQAAVVAKVNPKAARVMEDNIRAFENRN